MTDFNNPANVEYVHVALDIAFPQKGGPRYGYYPASCPGWLGNGVTKETIVADMTEALSAIPAPAGDVAADGGSTFKRKCMFAQEFAGQDLFDTYYSTVPPVLPKPTAQQIYERVFGGQQSTPVVTPPAPPIVIPPAPPVDPTPENLDARMKFVESLLLENVEPRLAALEQNKVDKPTTQPQAGPGIG